MMNDINWIPDFDKWYNVHSNAYKFIFEQAEKKLEDVLSESESITNKSIKLVTGIVAMFAFLIGFLLNEKVELGYNIVFIVLLIVNVAGVVFLIFPKEVKGRGFLPSELIPSKLDSDDDREKQVEMLYYSAIVNLENDIQLMRSKNKFRATIYLISLILALVIFSSGSLWVILELNHP